ncbi:MAG: hypothetical protein I4O51_07990 [Flavobacterium micromati]|nr:hypothetical protein [Flavobacterium micromati]
MYATIYTLVLIIHIISGFAGLASGTVAISKTNSIKTHKIAGKVFFYAMLFIFITSTLMCLMKTNHFLLLIGFFSFYLTCTGLRILQLKSSTKNKLEPTFVDYVISITGISVGILILIFAYLLFQSNNNFGIVSLFFGSISIFLGVSDGRKFSKTLTNKFHWINTHAMRMAGAYVATVTAFIVVNVQINQGWILWILPSLIIIPIAKKIVKNKVKQFQTKI